MTVQGMKDPVGGDTQARVMNWETPGGWADDQYVLKEKFWSWSGDDYKAKTRAGRTVCRFKGDIMAFNSTIRVKDLNQKEIYLLDQKTQMFGETFKIKQNGNVIAELKKDAHFAGQQNWQVHVGGRVYWTITGTFYGHQFVFRNPQGQIVAKSGRSLWQMESYNEYGVQIGEGTDRLLVLSVLAMMDTANDQ